jgi:hypothetical protein
MSEMAVVAAALQVTAPTLTAVAVLVAIVVAAVLVVLRVLQPVKRAQAALVAVGGITSAQVVA